jgi:hypothetical protein
MLGSDVGVIERDSDNHDQATECRPLQLSTMENSNCRRPAKLNDRAAEAKCPDTDIMTGSHPERQYLISITRTLKASK